MLSGTLGLRVPQVEEQCSKQWVLGDIFHDSKPQIRKF
jgi:hypothetical protein